MAEPKTKKPCSMAGLVNGYKKTDSMVGFLKGVSLRHSNTRCYKSRPIPRGKGISAENTKLPQLDHTFACALPISRKKFAHHTSTT